MAGAGGIQAGRRISGASGTLRYWLRWSGRKRAGRKHPEDGICARGAERYDFLHYLRGAGAVWSGIGDLIFLFMIYRFMVIAFNAPDLFGALIVVGVMAHVAIQVILNIAVVTNTIPNTGITLPFISYGGTSVLFLMVEMGMVLSVSNQIKMEK